MRYLTALIGMMFIISCGDDEALKQSMIASELSRKMEAYRQELLEECRQAALAEAEMIVDSILLAEDREDIHIKADIPPKPKYIATDTSVYKSQSIVKPLNQGSIDNR